MDSNWLKTHFFVLINFWVSVIFMAPCLWSLAGFSWTTKKAVPAVCLVPRTLYQVNAMGQWFICRKGWGLRTLLCESVYARYWVLCWTPDGLRMIAHLMWWAKNNYAKTHIFAKNFVTFSLERNFVRVFLLVITILNFQNMWIKPNIP